MLAGACWGVYPTLLPSSTSPARDLTLGRAITGTYALQVGLVWWILGMSLAIGYQVFVYSRFKGKMSAEGKY
jgi:cytochrome d ubiquinol oxidase subunit II